MIDLKAILFKRLKCKKACDIYELTVEHLRYVGDNTLSLLVKVINDILKSVSCLSSPQLNTAIATVVYKGKNKPIYHHKLHRLVRVTPLITRLIDEYVRPVIIEINKKNHNHNQSGYSKGVNYLLAALQRHEAEKYCLDNKKTFFSCSLDSASAF